MKTNGIIFIIAFLIAFGGGYLFFGQSEKGGTDQANVQSTTSQNTDKADVKEDVSSVPAEAEALMNNSCLSCHAVSSMGLEGGTTGPDLSNVFMNIEGKHGKDLDAFLQEPTTAVMSGVISGDPLSDEERTEIVNFLKKASEQ
ncbi:c-type cytochrome [Sporosarcina sp. FSL W8-0480]|uniref:c-type cytochrome n=1 Tax=Sporosarcina sp. FSL W8-0480 TaxID=2954701 RepID=UPI0030DCCF81